MPPLSSLGKSDSVPLEALKVSPPAPLCAPWLITGLVLMGLNSYFSQLSPASLLWSPLKAVVPVLHWVTSWWFVLPGWEPNLVSLAPLSHTFCQSFLVIFMSFCYFFSMNYQGYVLFYELPRLCPSL
ncbi:hypothetical protein DSO57_1005425 [Entomophthora muscae]|uniref:Uncharacterized protein n=1 Tax=Entomophthora muscae TaxID=34485 RepID=A0ACC2TVP4_9FUNG|nr:hypothetical protein DSO57_1005425 [Entomophthora muscae]